MVYRQPKTINEIADCLGVSPVYVESEAEFLEEYGFLIKKDNKYLTSFLIDEPNEKIAELHEKMYSKAAQIFANDLYDSLLNSGILKSPGLVCNQSCEYEDNIDFMLWSLIPYIAALSGESLIENRIAFDEVATIRPDGAVNIAYASIEQKNGSKLKYYESIRNWCGPCWNSNSELILWQIDSEWSEKRVGDNYQNSVQRDLALLGRFLKGEPLSMDEYAYLIETSSGSFTFTADSPKAVEVMNFYAELTQLGLIENVEAGDAPNIWYDINIAKSGKSAFWMS